MSELDNLFNTGMIWYMLFEIFCTLIQPYPFLHNEVYYEDANDFSAGIAF